MTFKEVVQKIIRDFEKANIQLTPKAYKNALCKELGKAGISHPECEQLQKAIAKLSAEYQRNIKIYPIKSVDDLNHYLISQVNRLAPNEAAAHIELLSSLCDSICESVALLKNHDATLLANTTIDKLKNSKNQETFNALRKDWTHFTSTYSDKIFDALDPYVKVHKSNWESIIEDVKNALRSNADMASVVDIILKALKPSFTTWLDKEIDILSKKIAQDTSIIKTPQISKEILELIDKRIELDKQELKSKLGEIDSTLEVIAKSLSMAERAGIGSGANIGSLKTMISGANADDFENIKQKMVELANTIENDIQSVTSLVRDEASQIEKMQKRISELESKLEETKKDASVDFLTKLLNRKVLEEALVTLENAFLKNNENYSLVFFDIDHFKNINDKYGHLAGDAILSAFASIIQKRAKGESYVGRWGGEEFVMALPNKGLSDAKLLADQIRNTIMQTKFLYKNLQISVTTSAGVAERCECDDLRHTLKMADERLYVAKNSGRNRVEPAI